MLEWRTDFKSQDVGMLATAEDVGYILASIKRWFIV